jgi:ubiquinone biosynthesis protein UbiJ
MTEETKSATATAGDIVMLLEVIDGLKAQIARLEARVESLGQRNQSEADA